MTEGTAPFQVVGIDYAGPVKYRDGRNKEGKAYIVLYACSLSRALYLELTKTMRSEEFISTLKWFIADIRESPMNKIFERFSSWYRLKKFIAWALRYHAKLRVAVKQRRAGHATKIVEKKIVPISLESLRLLRGKS